MIMRNKNLFLLLYEIAARGLNCIIDTAQITSTRPTTCGQPKYSSSRITANSEVIIGPIVPVMAGFAGPICEMAAANRKGGNTVVKIAMVVTNHKAGTGICKSCQFCVRAKCSRAMTLLEIIAITVNSLAPILSIMGLLSTT